MTTIPRTKFHFTVAEARAVEKYYGRNFALVSYADAIRVIAGDVCRTCFGRPPMGFTCNSCGGAA